MSQQQALARWEDKLGIFGLTGFEPYSRKPRLYKFIGKICFNTGINKIKNGKDKGYKKIRDLLIYLIRT